MIAIRDILIRHCIPYFDKNLIWGAALSVYRDELRQCAEDEIPVLVELRLDAEYPERALIIDHHNDRAGKDRKTSLEQTAALLGIELDRHQRLISANDRGHIPAMQALGASPSEIAHIRIYDRQCQGVTADDEIKAEESIRHHSEILHPQTIFVNSLTEKTSPVMDRLFNQYTYIFIVTPSNDLSYFGPGHVIEKLEHIYRKLKEEKPDILYWKGGNLPDYGFFGSTRAIAKPQVIELLETV
ncbi:MAG: hypothetical protein ACM3SY_17390 [Candidatus Omnitrophota bacterium]